ncbi:uncharacterized protein BO88DRAFT_468283 [Aspergillus vadensis CBS 113365]|uniref:t-SNARE coiled-coil homology domain-containing protein n=1 Tax=Aspergillus vadensis (strain CBS 113365 / IMI 142717 / IBT 24658) TaxID=1448311 RepID=A0A319BMU1_ASPVC|nr:hypothetical protein BO88DRAFT_468283 [Aspergillus vadensis CBS 113365]PYH73671.1 hypothetical protein BO88DRAFT_468283 [Aspergillus vadensis CBS 113365]
MATTLWDPDRILQITKGPYDQGMFCLGRARSRYDSRCRWDIPYSDYQIIRKSLSQLARKLPHEISDDELKEIAERGLCDYHCGQVHEVVSEWHDTLASLQHLYWPYKKQTETRHPLYQVLQDEIKNSSRYPSPGEDSKYLELIEAGNLVEAGKLYDFRALQTRLENTLDNCWAQREENVRLRVEAMSREQDCAHLQELLGEVKAELSDVQGNNSTLTCTISDLQGACDLKMKQLTEITAELSIVRGNNNSLKDANEEMRKEVYDKQKQLNEVTVELSNVRHAIERFRIFNEDMRKEINGKREQIETITSQLSSVSADLDSTTKELSVACEMKGQVQNDLHAALEEISNLQAQLTEIQVQQSTTIWCKIKRWIQEKASCLSRDRRRRGIRVDEEEVALAPVKPSNLA